MASRAPLWLNLGRTCNLSLGNLGMGLVIAITGAAMLDLVQLFGSSLASISYLITTRGIGALLGSFLGGKLHDTYNTQVVSIVATALTCITVIMTPLSGYLPVAHVMVFLLGLSGAAFETGANVSIIRMWPENSTPALQAFHLAFGIGGLLGPFIARPFLSTGVAGNTSAAGFYLGSGDSHYGSSGLLLVPNDTAATNVTGETDIVYAYGIVGAFFFLLTASMIALYFVDRADFKPEKEQTEDGSSAAVDERASDVCFSRTALAAMCAFIGFYVALECTTSQMVASFAVKSNLHFSKPAASRVEALFFLCFSAGRLGAALVTVKLPPFWMLVISHTILIPTAIVLVIWGSSIDTVLWVCIALTGIGQGPVYAAIISWTAGHIEFSNKMMSIAVVTESIGAMAAPTLTGQFMDKIPNVFLYVCLGAVGMCTLVFFCMYLYLRIAPHLSKDKELLINDTDDKPDEGVLC